MTLAWPIIMSHMGHMMASVADSLMVGQLGKVPLAAVGLSTPIYALILLFGIGLATGLVPIVSKAAGEDDVEQNKSVFKHGLIMNVGAGVVLSLLMLLIIPIFPYLDQPPEVVDEAIPYYIMLAASTFFSMIFFHYKQFGEGIQLVKTTMWVTIWGNVLNIFLNFVFLKGWFGLPELGTLGVGLATLISRIVMAIALINYFKKSRMRMYIDAYAKVKFNKEKFRNILKGSIPIAFQYIIEMSTFTMGAIMTGWFGTDSLAAHQIAMNVAATVYLVGAGLGSATSVLVGNAYGKRDIKMLNDVIKKSVVLILSIMVVLATLMIIGREFVPTRYNKNPEVIELASILLIIAAIFQLFDGLQVVGLGVLRGINDLKISTYIAMFSYLIIAIPACYIFSVVLNYETQGVWIGFLIGLIVSSTLLFARIHNRRKVLGVRFVA